MPKVTRRRKSGKREENCMEAIVLGIGIAAFRDEGDRRPSRKRPALLAGLLLGAAALAAILAAC